jgi:hypothetical protein
MGMTSKLNLRRLIYGAMSAFPFVIGVGCMALRIAGVVLPTWALWALVGMIVFNVLLG